MRECRDCDFPRKFARYFDWRSDGTIISTDNTRTRSQITFLEAGVLENLLADLGKTIGFDIDRLVIQAQKNIGKAIYANLPIRHMKRVPATRFTRPQWLAGLLVRAIAGDIAGLGDGRVSLDKYVAGETLVIRFRNPVVAALLVGSLAGIYESIEDMPGSEVEYRTEDGDLVVSLTHGQAAAVAEDRFYLEEIREGEGPLRWQRCLACGVPLEGARTWQWDIDEGIINNRRTGARDVVVAVQSVNAILRELESELGEDVPKLVYDHQKAVSLKKLTGKPPQEAAAYLEERLMEMALRGMGYPAEFQFTGSAVSVEIGNAYNQMLYAAQLAADLESVTGASSEIEWHRREPYAASYSITT